ncbi:MAG: FAD-dependent oxidoreductase [Pirellulales bacterium]
MPRKQPNRRRFHLAAGTLALATSLTTKPIWADQQQYSADVVIIGGGLGGCAAALASLRNGLSVVMTEPTDWLGGQLTSQGVPPDEHKDIETHGANRSYRELRQAIRAYYRENYRLTDQAKNTEHFNPGRGSVSRLCCEPRVAVAALESLFKSSIESGKLTLLYNVTPTNADCTGDRVNSVEVTSSVTGRTTQLIGKYFVDASELGDLLPLTGTEFVTGAESIAETGELHAASIANPDNQQAFTVCFAIDYDASANHVIEQPKEYAFWRDYVPQLTPAWSGRLLDLNYSSPRTLQPKLLGFDPTGAPTAGSLNLWNYRRLIDHQQFLPGQFDSDVSLVNWPQNDYFLGNLVGVSAEHAAQHVQRAKLLSLSLLYWLQTEVPRKDGGNGYPGLRLRRDIMGTEDGLAKAPYIRESRRIRSEFTILESHVGRAQREQQFTGDAAKRAELFTDSVGVGSYAIDLHPSTTGDNYIDFETHPFQIPLGALLPIRVANLLPACKNIGTTHLTSGCYRLHPVEWGIGESVGCLIAFATQRNQTPRGVRAKPELLSEFQNWIRKQGIETRWS